jgi:Tol biopolymer transport system component
MSCASARRSTFRAALLAGAIAQAPLAAQPADLVVRRLDPDGQAFSDVSLEPTYLAPKISPDGRWISFWYDGDTDDVPDLYVASRFGGAATRVSTPRPAGGSGSELLFADFSSDSRFVLFRIDQEILGRLELWSVPVDGDATDAVKLSGAFEPGETLLTFWISLDGRRVLFSSATAAGEEERLWSVPVDGGSAPVRIDPAGAANEVTSLLLTADGRAYFLDDSTGARHLWRVPADGSAAATRVSADLVTNGRVRSFVLTPDGARALYIADQRFVGVDELWSVAVAGPPASAVRLSPTLPAEGDVAPTLLVQATPPRILFRADTTIDGQLELWSVPLTGPATSAVHLNVALAPGGAISQFEPGGDRALYVAETTEAGRYEAWVVPIDGPFTASERLHGALDDDQTVAGAGWLPDTDPQLALLLGNLRDAAKLEIFVDDVDAPGSPASLFGDLPAGAGYVPSCGAGATPGFSAFVVCAELFAGRVQLFRLDVGFDTEPERLSNLFTVDGANVTEVVVSPDGVWAAFRADESVDERFDLYRARVDGSGSPARVHAAPAAATRDVVPGATLFTPDGRGLVYVADHRINDHQDVWIADAMIFGDGFELDGTGSWSSTVD